MLQPHQVVVGAVAGGGVHEAGTGIVGDVVAGQHRHVEGVTGIDLGQRMGQDEIAQHFRRQVDGLLPGGGVGRGQDRFGQLVGDDQPIAGHGPRREAEVGLGLHRGDLIDRIADLRIEADGAVGGDGPRCGRPDDDRRALEVFVFRLRLVPVARLDRELDPDGRRDVVVILDLGVGQGGALDRRPHDRLGAAVKLTRHQELVELRRDLGLGGEVHGGIALVPVAEYGQALEFLALDVDPLGGVFAAGLAELGGRHLVLLAALGAERFLDLPFDRQAVAVPARHVVDVVAHQEFRTDDEVLEDLVQRMANMDIAVGVGRSVVQHEQRRARGLTRLAHGVVEIGRFPGLEHFRLKLGQAGAHGKFGLGQEDGLAIVAAGGRAVIDVEQFGHGYLCLAIKCRQKGADNSRAAAVPAQTLSVAPGRKFVCGGPCATWPWL